MIGSAFLWLAIVGLAILPQSVMAQSPTAAGESSSGAVVPPHTTYHLQPFLTYTRPAEKTKLRNYFFEAVGPYPMAGAALAAGINQANNAPPEWKQGAEGYGKRFCVRLRHRSGEHHNPIRAGSGPQRRHVVLPLPV